MEVGGVGGLYRSSIRILIVIALIYDPECSWSTVSRFFALPDFDNTNFGIERCRQFMLGSTFLCSYRL